MKNTLIKMAATSLLLVFSQSVLAWIDPAAPSASHHLEDAATAIHDYLHDEYSSSFGAHGMEEASDALHSILHDWSHGEATEAEVVVAKDALKEAWNNFRQTINPAGILNSGDTQLDDMYQEVKSAYKEVRWLLRKAK
ncbi:MAG: hypothetical protein KJO54_03615 [Gammaproteobacteria bacterium]|nr:hypothetical protein [Gammaproteobacteria bacterium]NNF61531.1 hypothetical protein [Gammaproteobacteria bacterium]NNM19917.1 hypothetical protein [Gammaproteobacteria bacterium]